jgi:hypothetical protein
LLVVVTIAAPFEHPRIVIVESIGSVERHAALERGHREHFSPIGVGLGHGATTAHGEGSRYHSRCHADVSRHFPELQADSPILITAPESQSYTPKGMMPITQAHRTEERTQARNGSYAGSLVRQRCAEIGVGAR